MVQPITRNGGMPCARLASELEAHQEPVDRTGKDTGTGHILISDWNVTLLTSLPYIDNLAHVGGFVSGILAGLLLLPKIYFGIWDRRLKQFGMIISIPGLVLFFWYFLTAFYAGENNCTWCQYFNCIPGMPWCAQKFDSVVTSLKS
jgi:hypothetical protein